MSRSLNELEYIADYAQKNKQLPIAEELEDAHDIPLHVANRYLRQYKVFCYIDEYIRQKGYSPSLREIAQALHLSTSVVSNLIQRLTLEGYILYTPDTARSLRILRYPVPSSHIIAG